MRLILDERRGGVRWEEPKRAKERYSPPPYNANRQGEMARQQRRPVPPTSPRQPAESERPWTVPGSPRGSPPPQPQPSPELALPQGHLTPRMAHQLVLARMAAMRGEKPPDTSMKTFTIQRDVFGRLKPSQLAFLREQSAGGREWQY